MKTFAGDFNFFLDLLKNNIPHAIVRFGDGELSIIRNKEIDITKKCAGEFKFLPTDKKDLFLRGLLKESISFENPMYFKGIVCPCCGNINTFNEMKNYAKTNLTWANIFVNSNYSLVKRQYIPLLKERKTILICNKKCESKIKNLPFKPTFLFFVGTNAWKENFSLIEKVKKFLKDKQKFVLLSCAGPLSNILIYSIWKDQPNKNILINSGSIFDPWIFGKTRKYHTEGSPNTKKVCIWGED
jgi:hypothetical protein